MDGWRLSFQTENPFPFTSILFNLEGRSVKQKIHNVAIVSLQKGVSI
jgi:hypothetical protein